MNDRAACSSVANNTNTSSNLDTNAPSPLGARRNRADHTTRHRYH